jgi:energy-converting hydrogenase Eha subunit B
VLAKASSIAGSLFGGFAVGLLVYLLTRSAFPSLGSVLPNAVAVGGGLVLTVCALVAERMCIAPPGDDDDDDLPRGGTTQAH